MTLCEDSIATLQVCMTLMHRLSAALVAILLTACGSPAPPSVLPRDLNSVVPDRLGALDFEDMGRDFSTLTTVITRAGGDPAAAEIVGRVADDSETSVVAVRVPGVAATALAEAFVADTREVVERDNLGPLVVEPIEMGPKHVSKLATPNLTLYVWTSTDTMFYATAVDDSSAGALLRVLPPE